MSGQSVSIEPALQAGRRRDALVSRCWAARTPANNTRSVGLTIAAHGVHVKAIAPSVEVADFRS